MWHAVPFFRLANVTIMIQTIRFYPDVGLANSYIMLRPFFTPVDRSLTGPDFLKPSNWKFDISSADIPGIRVSEEGYFSGVQPSKWNGLSRLV